jgi:hypothetical protein
VEHPFWIAARLVIEVCTILLILVYVSWLRVDCRVPDFDRLEAVRNCDRAASRDTAGDECPIPVCQRFSIQLLWAQTYPSVVDISDIDSPANYSTQQRL